MNSHREQRQRQFTAYLLRLARMYRREVNHSISRHGLSDARAIPVLHIARAGSGIRQGVLAEELGLEGPSLVRLLDQLCAAGLVERHGDPLDSRAKTLHITDEGRALATTLEGVLHKLRTQLMVEISDRDLEATVRTMVAFEAALEARHGSPREG